MSAVSDPPVCGGVALQRREVGRAIRLQIALPRVKQLIERRAVEIAGTDRVGQRHRHLVAAGGLAGVSRLHDLAPPLQADAAQHGLAHRLGDARDLVVEGDEREQRLAAGGGREQGGEVAVVVGRPRERADGRERGGHSGPSPPRRAFARRGRCPIHGRAGRDAREHGDGSRDRRRHGGAFLRRGAGEGGAARRPLGSGGAGRRPLPLVPRRHPGPDHRQWQPPDPGRQSRRVRLPGDHRRAGRPGGPGARGLPLRRPAHGRALDRAPQCRPAALVDRGAGAARARQPRAPLSGRPRSRPRARRRYRGGAARRHGAAAGEALGAAHRGGPQRLGGGSLGAPALAGRAPHLRQGRGGLPRLSHPGRARPQSGGTGGALRGAGRRPAPLQPPAPRHRARRARRDGPGYRRRQRRRCGVRAGRRCRARRDAAGLHPAPARDACAAGDPAHRQCALPARPAGADAGRQRHPRRDRRHGAVDLRAGRHRVGHRERGGRAGGAPGGGDRRPDLVRCLGGAGLPARGHARRPHREGEARDLRPGPRRPAAPPAGRDPLRNLFLAGDWTATGLPATIEGAIRSGVTAARHALRALAAA